MTAETAWEPGDPIAPDNGCGSVPQISMREWERQAVIAEGGPTPPWAKPAPEATGLGYTRRCKPCGVAWRGEAPCWMCGQESQ